MRKKIYHFFDSNAAFLMGLFAFIHIISDVVGFVLS